MKPIWYFVGLLLLAIGLLVLGAGILDLNGATTVLAHLYPRVWWGGIMVLAGTLFLLFNRKKTIE